MDRREFLGLFSSGCLCCAAPSHARTKYRGCRLTAADGPVEFPVLLETSGNPGIDRICRSELASLQKFFNLRVTFGFFDDDASPNALATDKPFDHASPNGAVLFGRTLAGRILRAEAVPIVVVMAHEWAHIEQFKNKVIASWPVKLELDADKLAGEYLKSRLQGDEHREAGARVFSSLGTTDFAHPDYHGFPSQRADMFRSGYGIDTGIDRRGPSQ